MRAAAVLVLSLAAPVTADTLATEAQEAFDAKDYAEAASRLRRAYALDPDPRFVYGQGQALRYAGDCAAAVLMYERLLTLDATPLAKSDASAGIADCRKALDAIEDAEAATARGDHDDARRILSVLGSEPGSPEVLAARARIELDAGDCEAADALADALEDRTPKSGALPSLRESVGECRAPPAPEDPPAPPPPQVAPPPVTDTPDRPRRWIADPYGGVLFSVGIASAAVGGALLGVARRRFAAAGDLRDEAAYERATNRAVNLNTSGIVVLSVGGALIAASVIRYAVVARRLRKK